MPEQEQPRPSGRLDAEAMATFLAEAHLARVACVDGAGWPYIVPCWHDWDGAGWWVVPRARAAWAQYLRNDPRCAITIDEEGAQRKVVAQCHAQLVEEPTVGGQWVPIARRMAGRYLGEHGPAYLEATLDRPRWLFRLQPGRITTWQGHDWARTYR